VALGCVQDQARVTDWAGLSTDATRDAGNIEMSLFYVVRGEFCNLDRSTPMPGSAQLPKNNVESIISNPPRPASSCQRERSRDSGSYYLTSSKQVESRFCARLFSRSS
jgi:hypothetical protein